MSTSTKQNLSKLCEDIVKEYTMGMPDGVDEVFLRKLPVLFERINELEQALYPFARLGNRSLSNAEKAELIYCNTKDCVEAYNVLDSNQAYVPKKTYYYPA